MSIVWNFVQLCKRMRYIFVMSIVWNFVQLCKRMRYIFVMSMFRKLFSYKPNQYSSLEPTQYLVLLNLPSIYFP